MSFSNGMTGCSCGQGFLDSCPDCNESSPCSYQPSEYEQQQRKIARKLQEEKEKHEQEEFERLYKPFLALLMAIYPDTNEEELRKFFRIIVSMKVNKDNHILENVTVFLNVHKDNIKKKLNLTETCYLVAFFFPDVKSNPTDMRHVGQFSGGILISPENCQNICNFLVELNVSTFRGKRTAFSPNN